MGSELIGPSVIRHGILFNRGEVNTRYRESGPYALTDVQRSDEIEEIPDDATAIYLADFVESQVEWSGHSATVRSMPFNTQIILVRRFPDKPEDLQKDGFAEAPVHPKLGDKIHLIVYINSDK